jgi:hypothetical protein
MTIDLHPTRQRTNDVIICLSLANNNFVSNVKRQSPDSLSVTHSDYLNGQDIFFWFFELYTCVGFTVIIYKITALLRISYATEMFLSNPKKCISFSLEMILINTWVQWNSLFVWMNLDEQFVFANVIFQGLQNQYMRHVLCITFKFSHMILYDTL